MNNKLSILVSSPSSYSDVLDVFVKMFEKNWASCPYSLFISTNSFNPEVKKYIGYCSNDVDDGWVDRVIPSLKIINSEYILIICDDIFISSRPNESMIGEILSVMDTNKINYCRLKPCNRFKRINKNIGYLSTKTPYGKNLQIAIFRRDYLLNFLCSTNKNAWEIEKEWNREACFISERFFKDAICLKKAPIKFLHGVYKGMWIPSTKKRLIKEGFAIGDNRKTLSFSQETSLVVKAFFGNIIPFRLRSYTKRLLKKLGFTFATSD